MDPQSGSGSKKRKVVCHDDEDEDDDNEKMEKFFALIRSIREARDIIINGSDHDQPKKQKRNNNIKVVDQEELIDQEKPKSSVWNPSFQREDFAEDHLQLPNPSMATLLAASSSQIEQGISDHQNEEINNKQGLDLKLSL
uniref:Uncharacterized protein n=1 Tax=Davidia involucrata TaxID=16924 RepID=A0A5B7CA90_DAVIN